LGDVIVPDFSPQVSFHLLFIWLDISVSLSFFPRRFCKYNSFFLNSHLPLTIPTQPNQTLTGGCQDRGDGRGGEAAGAVGWGWVVYLYILLDGLK
jgi:hypothetical protein